MIAVSHAEKYGIDVVVDQDINSNSTANCGVEYDEYMERNNYSIYVNTSKLTALGEQLGIEAETMQVFALLHEMGHIVNYAEGRGISESYLRLEDEYLANLTALRIFTSLFGAPNTEEWTTFITWQLGNYNCQNNVVSADCVEFFGYSIREGLIKVS